MAQIPTALLEQIKQRVPISRLVAQYVEADKAKSQPGDLWACCPFHGDKSPSFHAEDSREIFHCFGCGATGDHFEFVERKDRVSFRDAVAKVAAMAGIEVEGGGDYRPLQTATEPVARVDPYEGYEFIPAPADAPAITAGKRTPKLRNPKKGTEPTYSPEAVYPYYNADGELIGYDLRVIIEGTKLTPTILWAKNGDWQGWCHGRLDKMPILGLEDLLADPKSQVLVVEGGKCRDAARDALGGRVVVVSWCGGTNAVSRTDWTPLAGRSLLLWPDHDDGGYKAVHEVVKRAKPLRSKWVRSYHRADDKGGFEKGADVADLIADGQSASDYIKANVSEAPLIWAGNRILEKRDEHQANVQATTLQAPGTEVHAGGLGIRGEEDEGSEAGGNNRDREPTQSAAQGLGGAQAPSLDWQSLLQYTKDGNGLDKTSMVNAALLLEHDDTFHGIFAWNDFSKEIALLRPPPWERSWDGARLIKETDITSTAMQMEFLGIKPKRSDMAAIIAQVSEYNRFNPVLDALGKLTWDGKPRLFGGPSGKQNFASMAVRYFGTENTDINAKFFAKTMIAAVARAHKPGCKVDTALILEGGQGAGKSTAIEVLAEAMAPGLYTDEIADPGSKDAGLQIQGRWIVEVSELDAFRRSETSTIKSWISRKADKFRRPYGKVIEDFPRSCVFIGSVNPPPHGYLKDPTGARRFWPVAVGEIDLPLLREDAEQLWAEAQHHYFAGMPWYLVGDEVRQAELVQAARMEGDPWHPLITSFVDSHQMALKTRITVAELMGNGCLNIPTERRTVIHTARIEAYVSGPLKWTRVGDGIYQRPLTA